MGAEAMEERVVRSEELWVEMSIRETWTQCHFAEIAYGNISAKSEHPTDQAFSSIHSFLSHCAMVSKMLKAANAEGTSIGSLLGVPIVSPIHNRRFRNSLEHYDRELKNWIVRFPGANIGTYNIGPKAAMAVSNMLFVSHYDLRPRSSHLWMKISI